MDYKAPTGLVWRFADRFAPREMTGDARGRAHLLIIVTLTMVLTGFMAVLSATIGGKPLLGVPFLVGALVLLTVLPILKRTGWLRPLSNVVAMVVFVVLAKTNLTTGGFGYSSTFSLGLVPMIALLLAGPRSAALWVVICLAHVGHLVYLHDVDYAFSGIHSPRAAFRVRVAGSIVIVLSTTVLAWAYDRLKQRALDELEELNSELEASNRRGQQASASKSVFLANVSHEIRTPMAGVIGMLDRLVESDLDDDQRGRAESAHRSAQALLQLLNDVIDQTRIDSGKAVIEKQDVDIRVLATDIMEVARYRAEDKNLIFSLEISPRTPPFVRVDPLRLRQVLSNLTSNAVKFTHSGSVRVIIDGQEADDGRVEVEFSVADTGIGIAPEDHDRVFDSFVQADVSTTRLYGGTGLGLSISRDLVRKMGGTLELESTPGVGSTFSFRLTLDEGQDPHEISKSLRRDSLAIEKGRVLVAEDNPINQIIVTELLQMIGCDAIIAENGERALEEMRRNGDAYNLVLMDCHMPIMDGFAATRAIRELPSELNQIPILALTASAMPAERAACRDAGMNDVLTKPIIREEFEALVGRWFQPGSGADGKSSKERTEPEGAQR